MTTFPASPRVTLRLVIYGRVQGVYFRESMRIEAQNLGVAGWVCNRSDGTVEAVVHGEAPIVDAIVRWAQRGSDHSHVDRVEIQPEQGAYSNFEVVWWG